MKMCAAHANVICERSPPKSAVGGNPETSDKTMELMTGAKQKLKQENPYKVANRKDFSKILHDEKDKNIAKYKKMLKAPVHRKVPARHISSVNVLRTIPPVPEANEPPPSPTSAIKNDPDFLQAVAKGEKLRNMENLTTFVNNKREMFLIQYMIGVKRDEMLRLVRRETAEDHRLSFEEKFLEEDAVRFSEFLRHNDREAVDAVKQAEMETKLKCDKITEIKKININIVNLKSKISKLEDIFTEYKLYCKFLTSVAPLEWKEQKLKERQQIVEQRAKMLAEAAKEQADKYLDKAAIERPKRVHITVSTASGMTVASQPKKIPRRIREKSSVCTMKDPDNEDHVSNSTSTILSEMISDLQLSPDAAQYLMEDDDDEKVELYFSDPGQLAIIFSELEEQNLALIQKCQETEESLEEVMAAFHRVQEKMKKETKFLKMQLSILERNVLCEHQKGEEFETMSKLYSFGEFNEEMQEEMLSALQVKIESVYTATIGPNDANLNSIQMLAAIETLLEDYFVAIERMIPSKFEAALKARERQRRALLRETRARELREYLLQRRLRTIQKAEIVRKPFNGRKAVHRSQPPMMKRKIQKIKWISRDEEEIQYFFT